MFSVCGCAGPPSLSSGIFLHLHSDRVDGTLGGGVGKNYSLWEYFGKTLIATILLCVCLSQFLSPDNGLIFLKPGVEGVIEIINSTL
jgi:hypothetical protein